MLQRKLRTTLTAPPGKVPISTVYSWKELDGIRNQVCNCFKDLDSSIHNLMSIKCQQIGIYLKHCVTITYFNS